MKTEKIESLHIPPPEASHSLGQRISLSLETKRLIDQVEQEVRDLDWHLPGFSPLDMAPKLGVPALHLITAGGKRIRPLLIAILGRALNVPFERLQTYAMASEFVHTATLLHDDVLDGATVRRGRISAHLKYNAHMSILSGDALLCKAMCDVARMGDPEILLRLSLALREVVEGECLQADLVGKVHGELDTVLEICRRKTGAIFAWSGWVVGHVAQKNKEELRKFGKHLGLAFQLLDDLLDWEGSATGKSKFQDLREAKLNSVGVVLCQKSARARSLLKESFKKCNTFQELNDGDTLGRTLQECEEYKSACERIQQQAEKESSFALANLESLPDSQWKQLIIQITKELLHRAH